MAVRDRKWQISCLITHQASQGIRTDKEYIELYFKTESPDHLPSELAIKSAIMRQDIKYISSSSIKSIEILSCQCEYSQDWD